MTDEEVKTLIRMRDNAIKDAVIRDRWDKVLAYCRRYSVPIPSKPRVLHGAIYKAACNISTMPPSVKEKARLELAKLGMTEHMDGYEEEGREG